MSMAIAIAMLFAGWIVGFLMGARARQIAAKLTSVGKAVLSMHQLLKIKEAAAGLEDAEAMAQGDEDENGDKTDVADPLDDFLNVANADGLDDHQDLELSPVMMYEIKKAKDKERAEKLRAALIADGLTPAEADERLAMAQEMGGAISDGKPNALSVLIAAGARVEAVKGATNEEMQKKIEMRRKQRNVAVFLQKRYEIEIKAPALNDGDGAGRSAAQKKTAYDVARDTKLQPVGGKGYEREVRRVETAKSARKVYRAFKIQDDADKKRKKRLGGGGGESSEVQKSSYETRRNNVGAVDLTDVAAILANEEEFEGGDEEGGDDDNYDPDADGDWDAEEEFFDEDDEMNA